MRSQNDRKSSASARCSSQPTDEGDDDLVEVLRGHAAEDHTADRGARTESASEIDVVGLLSLALLVARRRSLEAEVADPVLGARMRAAVEVQPERRDVVAEPVLERADSDPSRVFVSVTE